ncbi:putative membrane protein [Halanaeroarchaeum sp. HSR-CO]|uniref:hypothetical protein n=1 Tax=Halanaeroarchaeum sp. HSR-CO TaxID=2866382 RepID=UPI00217CFC1D|nr:hypothetical protein [Halanaeroarchaeum sp. HSR-CO]UWG46476.1 putative membrane protein [Halanaeroarchaeum sp. HSR-CO]
MPVRNRDGDPVDPFPWVVTAALAFMLLFSIGPIYLQEYGLSLVPSIVVLSIGFLGVVVAGYWRLVHTVRPDLRAEISPELRIQRLFYAILAGILLLLAVSIPIATQQG